MVLFGTKAFPVGGALSLSIFADKLVCKPMLSLARHVLRCLCSSQT